MHDKINFKWLADARATTLLLVAQSPSAPVLSSLLPLDITVTSPHSILAHSAIANADMTSLDGNHYSRPLAPSEGILVVISKSSKSSSTAYVL